MFTELSAKLEEALKGLTRSDTITSENIEPALKKVRRALIGADVNIEVTNEFLNEVKKEALGTEVVKGLRPDQKIVEIIHKKLEEVLGGDNSPIYEEAGVAVVVMLVGLQGSGKTTAAAKLALYLKEKGKKVLVVGADTFRPAGKDQIRLLAEQVGVSVFTENDKSSLEIAKNGVEAGKIDNDYIIVDTAGRLFVDQELMDEISEVKNSILPQEVLLVVDSMMGQEAAELAKAFDERLGLTGVVLTKLDGDSRGGAALSISKVSGKTIKFVGTGEKVEALEPFYPDRMAGRILGMGDILTLVDKAQKEVLASDVTLMQKKLQEASFNYNDFLQQMKLIGRMGSLSGLIKLIPGMNKIDSAMLSSGEQQLTRIQNMINSMTFEERNTPDLIEKNPKRRARIARGSGYAVEDVNKVVGDFVRMRQMMKQLTRGNLTNPFGNSDSNPSGLTKKASKKRKGFFEL